MSLLRLFLLSLFYCPNVVFSVDASHSTLRSVAVLMRHADRNPSHSFPYDLHDISDSKEWPEGAGNLNAVGRRNAVAFGKWIQSRYSNLFTGDFKVKAASDDMERVLETARLILGSVTDASHRHALDISISHRSLGDPTKNISDCPLIDRILRATATDPEYASYKETFERQMLSVTGWTAEQLRNVSSLRATLAMYSVNNKSLPDWVDDNVMTILDNDSCNRYCMDNSDIRVPALRSFLFLTELRDELMQKQPAVFNLFVAHGTRVTSLLESLFRPMARVVLQNGHDILFLDSVIFELHEDLSGCRFVQSYFVSPERNYWSKSLQPVTCASSVCPILQFFSAINDRGADDYDAKCREHVNDVSIVSTCFSPSS